MAAGGSNFMPGTCGPALLLLLLVLLAAAPAPADAFSDYSEEAELSVKIARITPRFPLAGGTFTASFDVTSEFDRSPVLETQVWADQPVLQNCTPGSGPTGDIKLRLPRIKAGGLKTLVVKAIKAPQAAGPRVLRIMIDSTCFQDDNTDGTKRYQASAVYTTTPAPIADLSFDSIAWAKNGRYEGTFWSAAVASKTFGVKISVSNQGTLPGKIGAIKFWSVPFGTPFVPSCNATADFSTTVKGDTLAPLGKFKAFTVKGIPAPTVPGKKTLVGFVDGDCATAEADEVIDNKITLDYKVLAQPLPEFLVTGKVAKRYTQGAALLRDFSITVKNVGLAPGAPGVVSIIRDAGLFRGPVNCTTSAGPGWTSAAAVTTPIDVGKSAVITVTGVEISQAIPSSSALVLVDSTCQVAEIFDAFEDVNKVHRFTVKYN